MPRDGVEMSRVDREKLFDFSDGRGVQLCKDFLLGRRATLTAFSRSNRSRSEKRKGVVYLHMPTRSSWKAKNKTEGLLPSTLCSSFLCCPLSSPLFDLGLESIIGFSQDRPEVLTVRK